MRATLLMLRKLTRELQLMKMTCEKFLLRARRANR